MSLARVGSDKIEGINSKLNYPFLNSWKTKDLGVDQLEANRGSHYNTSRLYYIVKYILRCSYIEFLGMIKMCH